MGGPKEWFLVFLIALLIFGAKRIPEIMRALGRGLGEFRKAREDFERTVNESASSQSPESQRSEESAANEPSTENAPSSDPPEEAQQDTSAPPHRSRSG